MLTFQLDLGCVILLLQALFPWSVTWGGVGVAPFPILASLTILALWAFTYIITFLTFISFKLMNLIHSSYPFVSSPSLAIWITSWDGHANLFFSNMHKYAHKGIQVNGSCVHYVILLHTPMIIYRSHSGKLVSQFLSSLPTLTSYFSHLAVSTQADFPWLPKIKLQVWPNQCSCCSL